MRNSVSNCGLTLSHLRNPSLTTMLINSPARCQSPFSQQKEEIIFVAYCAFRTLMTREATRRTFKKPWTFCNNTCRAHSSTSCHTLTSPRSPTCPRASSATLSTCQLCSANRWKFSSACVNSLSHGLGSIRL